MSKSAVIFGGTGFIGSFFAKELSKTEEFKKIYLADIENIETKGFKFRQELLKDVPNLEFIKIDVRNPIDLKIPEGVSLIANFSAIHREPGHSDEEYFETNLLGAENVCRWSKKVECNEIIFSSSIAPYGPTEDPKDENSLTVPVTPYGSSKLSAELIHQNWQHESKKERKLIIIRPGVVFGPGEGGNVSRLIKAVKGKYFIFMGNRNTRKAGIYVKELCKALNWLRGLSKTKDNNNFILANLTMHPNPSLEEYVNAIAKILKLKPPYYRLPFWTLLLFSSIIDLALKPFRISHPFSRVRIQKLNKSNHIIPMFLISNNYNYHFSLEEALKDWKEDYPEEW
tara:strand:- start:7 stop:1029 length:1023 start_codon:yes stop_codon:yes gene_type:complete